MAHRDGSGSAGENPLHAVARRVDDGDSAPVLRDPLAALRSGDGPRVAFAPPDGPSVVGAGAAATLVATGADRFSSIRDAATDRLGEVSYDGPSVARPRLLGGFAFDDDSSWEGFPGARFVVPRLQTVTDGDATWLTVTARGESDATAALDESVAAARGTPGGQRSAERSPEHATDGSPTGSTDGSTDGATDERTAAAASAVAPTPGVRSIEEQPPRTDWEANVRDAVGQIETGPLRKVVLAGALSVELAREFDLHATLTRLGETYPDCYRFAVDPGTGPVFFGATPELLVERDGDAIRTTALAGSIGRGDTDAADERLARELATSEKGRREHELVVEAVREQLAPFVDRVRVGERGLRTLETVQHLQTPIEGTLAAPTHVLDVADALHPTPAVGGLPPAAAMGVIRETEAFDRGWYAGPVGWFDAAGNGTFAVGIRSALVDGPRATLYAGNGIVGDSDPAAEWAELQLKYRPVLDHLR